MLELISVTMFCSLPYLVCHPFTVKLHTKEPRTDPGLVKVRHLVINVDKLLIFCDNSLLQKNIFSLLLSKLKLSKSKSL